MATLGQIFRNTSATDKAVKLNENIYEALLLKEANLAVVGLGYVGLPVALEFAKHYSVIGFDINKEKVSRMKEGHDPSGELLASHFENKMIRFHFEEAALRDARFYVVAVPTPIDEFNQPDLRALKGATTCVAKVLKKGDYVVFESTVYPGCTEEVCVEILEKISGLKLNEDFKVGYSPERINPGDKKNTIDQIVKVVSGSDEQALENIANVYNSIIQAGVHKAPSIKVAEAAKIVENTQRDVNIALMNELSMIFNKMDINTYDVLEAAGTKWNFLKFYPGLVGGHCIGVDPYYLIQKAIRVGHNPILISAGRSINDRMPLTLAQLIFRHLKAIGKSPQLARILVKGITFKENVTDIRNSKAADLILALRLQCPSVDVEDPIADPKEVRMEYGVDLCPKLGEQYDVVVVAVSHESYYQLGEDYYQRITGPDAAIFDIKGILRGQIKGLTYYSL